MQRLNAEAELCALDDKDAADLKPIQSAVRRHFTRQWPTRVFEQSPPAVATAVHPARLKPGWLEHHARRVEDLHHILVFLPPDWEGPLETLDTHAQLRVHRDIGSEQRRVYASWSCPDAEWPSQPDRPRPHVHSETHVQRQPHRWTLWLGLPPVIRVLEANQSPDEHPMYTEIWEAPVWLIAGRRAVWRWLRLSQDERTEASARAAEPLGSEEQASLAREIRVAKNYGPTPWLHMRYELHNDGQPLAVQLAPLAIPPECNVHASRHEMRLCAV